ncbi:MAG TPA: hypothetical protein VEQ58_08135 [Polyangiaceae bacterium]|nr:hypothetical protein [Polyangiaceae bacterium]
MRRKFLMVVLGLGAVAGFASGFAHLCHGYGHFGHGRFDRQSEFERRVADTCAESALRVYDRQGHAAKPGQAP